jgi:hypothetical protein
VENVWLAVVDDKPIFQYAAIPLRYRLPRAEATAMVSVDTMTDPDFQRRGLLSNVGRHTYETWRAAGVPFVIGLPNQRWGSRTGALGWEPLFPLQWLVRWLRPEVLLARRARLPGLSRLAGVGAAWNSVWDGRLPVDPVIAVRPVAEAGPELYHVLWAERAGAPAGYLAYRVEEAPGRRLGYIAELFTRRSDDRARAALIRRAVSELRAAGADTAAVLVVPATPAQQAFRRAGFISSWGSFSVELVPLAADLPMDVLRDPRAWEMAGGDFDVV